jgi:hypothetical protein
MISNGASFILNGGNSMDLGSGASYGRDGSRPASAAWLFTVTIFRL